MLGGAVLGGAKGDALELCLMVPALVSGNGDSQELCMVSSLVVRKEDGEELCLLPSMVAWKGDAEELCLVVPSLVA